MNENVYIVDHERFVNLNLPTFLRTAITGSWLNALVKPLKELYNTFIDFKADSVYKVSHDASVVLMQKVLNDYFDNTLRRIRINNVQQVDLLRFYPFVSNKKFAFYDDGSDNMNGFKPFLESDPNAADFVVNIPIALQPGTQDELDNFLLKVRAQLDYYKLYAKKYRIEWIN